jgi:hypothetical protein
MNEKLKVKWQKIRYFFIKIKPYNKRDFITTASGENIEKYNCGLFALSE